MRAAMFYGKEDVRIEDIAEPQVRPGPIPPAPTAGTPHPLSGETLPIGLLVAAVLKAKGFPEIVSEVSRAHREKALSSGVADAVVDPAHEDLRAVAIHTKPVELNVTTQLTMKDRVLGSSVGYASDEEAIELVRGGKVELAPFITRRIRVEDIVPEGIERLMTHKDEEVKILVSMR